ncbi:unnamed protein product [Mytilus edulis]|uniref:Uncharacterized protein n=1 Tax=Mytilus edulis TaxID=6550 RepID=A0A8S3Q5J3_MYTED|nr:unnamed protein product [Mytilus edulis]
MAKFMLVESSNYLEEAPSVDVVTFLESGAVAIAILLSIFLSCFEKNNLGGRPGIVIPINFLQDDNLAIVYAAAFGCTSNELVTLIFNTETIINSMKIPTLVVPWVRDFSFCFERRIDAYFIVYIPTSLCYVILIGYFLYKSVRQTYKFIRRLKQDTDYKRSKLCASQLQYNYVKWLLKKPEYDFKEKGTGLKRSIKAYSKDIKNKIGLYGPLHASPRVIATFVAAGIVLFQVGMGLLTFYIHDNPGLQLTTYIQTQYLNTSKECINT